MTSLWFLLLIKSTGLLCAGLAASRLLKCYSSAARHLVWLCAFCGLLLLFPGLLLHDAVPGAWTIQATAGLSGRAASIVRHPAVVWLRFLWVTGVVLLVLRTVVSFLQAVILVSRSRALRDYHGCSIRVANITTPVSWSFGRGYIVLPPEAQTWDPELFDSVLQHEYAHLLRLDSLALLVSEVACALYWFHPLAWYARYRMRIEQEHAADDYVLRCGFSARAYAACLVQVVRSSRREALLAGVGSRSTLGKRVEAILNSDNRRVFMNRRLAFSIVAAAMLLAVPLAGLQSDRKIYKIGGDVSSPVVLVKEEPNYTQEARDAKVEGNVLLSIVIETDGRASGVRVERGLDPGLDANAVAAINRWLFQPAQKDGEPVAVSARVEVNFRLK